MAADVGATLLAEVEEMGLDEVLQDIRGHGDPPIHTFNFPPLDKLLQAMAEIYPANHSLRTRPIVELLSLKAGGGKTQLLYHLCAKAVLPEHLGGQQGAVAVVDPDGRFFADRVAIHVQTLLRGDNAVAEIDELDRDTLSALKHLHIFRPQSLASTSATLATLPDYLFSQSRHHSYDRQVAFIVVVSASTFYWQDRSQTENAAFVAVTDEGSVHTQDQSGYKRLATSLSTATTTLRCPAIVTTWHLHPPHLDTNIPRSYRQQLPDFKPNLRLVVRRLQVRQYPPGVDVDQAVRESGSRQEVVDRSRFECFLNRFGVEDRHLGALNGQKGGFCFSVRDDGLEIESQAIELAEKEQESGRLRDANDVL